MEWVLGVYRDVIMYNMCALTKWEVPWFLQIFEIYTVPLHNVLTYKQYRWKNVRSRICGYIRYIGNNGWNIQNIHLNILARRIFVNFSILFCLLRSRYDLSWGTAGLIKNTLEWSLCVGGMLRLKRSTK